MRASVSYALQIDFEHISQLFINDQEFVQKYFNRNLLSTVLLNKVRQVKLWF